MKIAFEKLSPSSRLWVYQSDRKLSAEEIADLKVLADEFVENWEAHGQPLAASYEIRFDQFLVISVDEGYNGATGCSIDASVSLVRQIESKLGVSMLDRKKIAFLQDDQVFLQPLAELKSKVDSGTITKETQTFNNSVSSLKDYTENWLIPSGTSWMARYFN